MEAATAKVKRTDEDKKCSDEAEAALQHQTIIIFKKEFLQIDSKISLSGMSHRSEQCKLAGMIIIMNQLSSKQILKAQRNLDNQFFLQHVRREAYNNKLKISKQVYNLESRNIKKFTKEWEAFQQKFRAGKDTINPSKSVPVNKTRGKYEQDQLLELSFGQQFKPSTPSKAVNEQASAMTIRNSSRDRNSSTRNVTFKTPLKNRYSFRVNYVESSKSREHGLGPRQKSNSLVNDRLSLRKRVATQWDLSPMKESQSKISIQKGQTASNTAFKYNATDEFIIDVTRDKMDRFIRSLHRLEWAYNLLKEGGDQGGQESRDYRSHMKKFEYDADSPINEQAINFMVSRRYHLHSHYLEDIYEQRDRFLTEQSTSNQRKKLADENQYPLISSLANHSILRLLKKNLDTHNSATNTNQTQRATHSSEVHFALPHCEFISFKETKNSIYQLVGMSARMGLKLAFSIFDKNRNGLIDEDDLLQLISLSRSMPTLEIDITTLARAMLSLKESKRPLFQKPKLTHLEGGSSRLRETRERNVTLLSKESEEPSNISPIEEKDSDSESESNQKSLSTSRFSIDKLYTFLREKEKERGARGSGRPRSARVHSLNFLMFCKAFEFRRPYLVYDLFQFLFSASLSDFKQHIQAEINSHLRKLQTNHLANVTTQQEETLQEKWNKRLKISNAILESFIRQSEE